MDVVADRLLRGRWTAIRDAIRKDAVEVHAMVGKKGSCIPRDSKQILTQEKKLQDMYIVCTSSWDSITWLVLVIRLIVTKTHHSVMQSFVLSPEARDTD
jgi:hypothetical protein